MIPKLFGLAAVGASTLLASGIALGRWSQTLRPPAIPATVHRATETPAPADQTTALAAFQKSLTAFAGGNNFNSREDWGKTIDALDADSLPAAWAATGRIPAQPFRNRTRIALLHHWASIDPAAAATAATALPAHDAQEYALRTVATLWLRKDFPAAAAWCARQPGLTLNEWELRDLFAQPDAPTPTSGLAAADTFPAGALRETLRSVTFTRLSQTDPEAALAYARRQPADGAREELLVQALSAMAGKDPTSTLAQLNDLPLEKRLAVIAAAAAAAAARDPLEALPYLDQLPTGQQRMRAADAIVKAMLAEDPEIAVDFALTFPAGEMQRRLVVTATNGFVHQNPAAALQWLNALPDDATKHLILKNSWWSIVRNDQLDPQSIARFVLALPKDLPRSNALETVVERLAHANIATAAAWVQQLADTDLRESGLRALAGAWSTTDTVGASLFAQHLAEEERTSFLTTIGQRQAQTNVGGITALASLLPPGAARNAFMQGAVSATQRTQPRLAADLVDTMSSGPVKLRAANSLLESWAGENPLAAADWLRRRPELSANATTCSVVTREWAEWDADGAAQWVSGLPFGASRTAAVEALVEKTTATAPALAATWATQIADPAKRIRTLTTIATTWLRADRVAASAWLTRADLPQESIQALLAGQPVPGGADEDEIVVLSPFEWHCGY